MNNLNSYKSLDKKDRIDFYIALVVIISMLSFIVYFSFSGIFSGSDEPILDTISNDVQLSDTLVIEGQKYVPFILEKHSNKKIERPESIENIYPAIVVDSTAYINDRVKTTKSIESETIGNENVSDKTSKVIPSVNTIDEGVDESVSDVENGKENILEIDTTIALQNNREADEEPTVEKVAIDKSCIIAVGIYKNKTNANKMMLRLEDAGYNPFITARRNRHQVQVYHECNNITLNRALNDIRKSYASDAVIFIKK